MGDREFSYPGFILIRIGTSLRPHREPIGYGGSGSIHLAEILDDKIKQRLPPTMKNLSAVVKFVADGDKNNRAMVAFRQEVAIMWNLRDSPNIVPILAYSENPCGIVMPYLEMGSLESVIYADNPASRNVLLSLISDISRGLLAMHRAGIAHLDIKPANVLIHKEHGLLRSLLTDFGVSQIVSGAYQTVRAFSRSQIQGHTFLYAPPEILLRRIPDLNGLLAVDIYSFSLVILTTLNRQRPWKLEGSLGRLGTT
jgi:serine/threonine-protein kinase